MQRLKSRFGSGFAVLRPNSSRRLRAMAIRSIFEHVRGCGRNVYGKMKSLKNVSGGSNDIWWSVKGTLLQRQGRMYQMFRNPNYRSVRILIEHKIAFVSPKTLRCTPKTST